MRPFLCMGYHAILIVSMDATEYEVDTEIGDNHAEERQGAVKMEGDAPLWPVGQTQQGVEIDDEGYESPDLLGIP